MLYIRCMRVLTVLLISMLCSLHGFAQKFRFASSIGTSIIQWHENQTTIDLGAQLIFQKPGQKHFYFAKLKTIGNVESSEVDRSRYTFVESPMLNNNMPLSPTEPLSALYRGGQAEIGTQLPIKNGLSAILSIYSKSIARKITSNRTQYIEEEKYALHGLSIGLNYEWKFKNSSLNIYAQGFEPLYHDVTLYGRYIGVPFSSETTDNLLNYKGGIDLRVKKFGIALKYEQLNFGAAKNPKSKTIESTQAQIISSLVTYYF